MIGNSRKDIIKAIQFLIRVYSITPMELLGRKNKPFYDRMENFNRIWKEFF